MMHQLRRLPLLSRRVRAGWAGAVLIVLAAQWLALVHAVVHTPGLAAVAAAVDGRPACVATVVDWVAGHEAGSAACVLLDQLAHAAPAAAAIALPPVDLPVPPPSAWVPLPPRVLTAAAYRARAPPVRA